MYTSKILPGQKFGKLTVLGIGGHTKAGKILWECQCECGNKCLKETKTLLRPIQRGGQKSCGCWQNRIDLTGQRFGKLVVIGTTDIRGKDGHHFLFKCQCDCGNIKYLSSNALICNKATSCGCVRDFSKYGERLGGIKKAIAYYINRAKKRGVPFELTEEQFGDLIYDNCYYCGKPASRNDYRGVKRNGIDRFDNDKGYVTGNVVSCCAQCNIKKGTTNGKEYIEYCKQVANYERGSL